MTELTDENQHIFLSEEVLKSIPLRGLKQIPYRMKELKENGFFDACMLIKGVPALLTDFCKLYVEIRVIQGETNLDVIQFSPLKGVELEATPMGLEIRTTYIVHFDMDEDLDADTQKRFQDNITSAAKGSGHFNILKNLN